MSVIHLRHLVHGTKMTTAEAEAVHDELHGWFRFDPRVPEPVAVPDAPTLVNVVEEVLTDTPPPVYNEIVPPTAKAATAKKAK